MNRMARVGLLTITCAVLAGTSISAQKIIAKEGREEFEGVEYVGGDATHPKKVSGWLVLKDSTLSIHKCIRDCQASDTKPYYDSLPDYQFELRSVTSVTSSSDVRGASVGSKMLFGGLAGDRKQEFVLVRYENDRSAEAPYFKTKKSQSASLEAKIRFRLKKLGVVIPDAPRATP